jgi:ribonuclease J
MQNSCEDKTSSGDMRLIPLGGLGEIGMNMMALEYDNALLIIDCGLMFPEARMLGIDLVLPDTGFLQTRKDDIRGLLLTHGHEDHIGGLPYLLEPLGFPPIYGTPLTLGLLSGKLVEHGLERQVDCHRVTLREPFELAPFTIEFFRAAHSITDGAGIAIRTKAGLVVHTGDFKLDPTPLDGETTDIRRLQEFGDEGVLLLLSDSTNVEQPGRTRSEREVGEAINQILPDCKGRVLISTFASNIHRIQQIVDAAIEHNRKLLINGRSMLGNIAIARQLGYLQIPDNLLVDLRDYQHLPRHRVMALTTGSQGEPLSALSRIAVDEHKQIFIETGDTVILSSKFIPGNEKAISELINNLYRLGAEVHYETTSEIHVSGHASRDELQQVLNLTRPYYFVPIHGEYRHLAKHADLARQNGIAPERAIVLENGLPLRFSTQEFRCEESIESGRIFVDGKGVGDVGSIEVRDRQHLANHGVVIVLLALDRTLGTVLLGPELLTRGFVNEEQNQDLLDQARQKIIEMLSQHGPTLLADHEEVRVEVRKTLRRFLNNRIHRRPLILPIIHTM